MTDPLSFQAAGTRPAWFPSSLTDSLDLGFEEPLVGKKFSRSLQDDAFGADESVSRRSRVMGQRFADAHEDDAPAIDEGTRRRDETLADPTEDPVRMYLMQMGQIPLLTRQQEVSAAKQIEKTRDRYRHSMMATDFMLQGALKMLEQVRDKNLRLDRTIEVSVTNAVEKKAIMKRIVPNVRTLQHLLRQNRNDYMTSINKRLPMRQRRAAWRNLVIRRNKAVRLVEEMKLRTGKLQPIFEKLRQASDRMIEIRGLLADPETLQLPGMPTVDELNSELRSLMRLTFETPQTLARRVRRCDQLRDDYDAAKRVLSAGNLRLVVSIAKEISKSWTVIFGSDPRRQHRI